MSLNYELAPSILSADFNRLGEQLCAAEKAGARYVHFDVMDGLFVPSISFGMPVLASICDTTDQVMDVHLMVVDPIRYVEEFKKAGADIVTVHYEACVDLTAVLKKIKELGMKTGVSVKPYTEVDVLAPYLDMIDMVLIMSVEPGFGGQSFIPSSLDKIRELRKLSDDRALDIDIEVDGGIYHSNVDQVLEAGANIIVSGSGVFKGDIEENVHKFLEIIKSYEK